MPTRWFSWFWLRACPIECKCRTVVEWSQLITIASSRVHWRGSLWINVFQRSSSNPEGFPERAVSLMSKRYSFKRENFFLAVLVPIHGANVSGRLRCFRPYIELKEKNMSEIFQFLHLSVHGFTHYIQLTKLRYVNSSTTIALQIKKWQSINEPIATRIPTRETKSLRNYAPT